MSVSKRFKIYGLKSEVGILKANLAKIEERVIALESIVTRFGGCYCDGCIDSALKSIAEKAALDKDA